MLALGKTLHLSALRLWPPAIYLSQAGPHSAASTLSKLSFKCSCQVMVGETCAPGKPISAVTLWIPDLGGKCFLWPQFSEEFKKMYSFLVCLALFCCKKGHGNVPGLYVPLLILEVLWHRDTVIDIGKVLYKKFSPTMFPISTIYITSIISEMT